MNQCIVKVLSFPVDYCQRGQHFIMCASVSLRNMHVNKNMCLYIVLNMILCGNNTVLSCFAGLLKLSDKNVQEVDDGSFNRVTISTTNILLWISHTWAFFYGTKCLLLLDF